MKMLCTEGKSGCGRAEILLSFFFFLFFFNTLFSQVPINGFCGVSVFETLEGYDNLFLSDINFDEKEDVILYDKTSNSLLLNLSTVKGNLSQPIKKFFYFPVSKIEEIGKGKKSRTFLFLSRKEKLIGLISINKNKKIKLLDIISYKSIPSNFSIKKNRSSKTTEAIIYGEPFEGIALLQIGDGNISEKRIFSDNVFKSAAWIDLNYDGREDIAAYDIFDGELLLLINDGENNFSLERTIKIDDRLQEIKRVDWNGDGFNDLFYSKENGFEILLGDSVSSFSKKIFIETAAPPKKSAVADFNNDGKPDVAWLEEGGGAFLIFSKKDSTYSKPQKYLNNIIFADIKESSLNNALFLLTDAGQIFELGRVAERNSRNMLLTSGNPVRIEGFRTNRYNDISLAYFDSLSGAVRLLISELNVFNKEFQFPAAENHSEFKVFFTSDSIRTFLLFSKGEKLIEVFRFNIYNYSVSSFEIYSKKNLYDVIAVDKRRGGYLLALTKERNAVEVTKYIFSDDKFMRQNKLFSGENILDAAISFRKKLKIYYMRENNDSLFIWSRILTEENNDGSSLALGSAEELVPRIFLLTFRKNEFPVIVNKEKRSIDVVVNNAVKRIPLPDDFPLPLTNIKSFYFMGFNYLFIQPEKRNSLIEAQLDLKMNFLGEKKVVESEEVIDYFGTEFMKFPYLFYINKENEIKFEKF